MSKCILFDADGVLTLPEEMFSIVYARSHALDPQPFEDFFRNEWQPIVTGSKDLKEHIKANPDLWQWDGSVDELLEYWFRTEDVRNEELLKLIAELKNKGIHCYLATDQEKYRADYMKNVMFKGLFSGYFVSAELGTTKTDPRFFELVLERLGVEHPGLEPSDVIFFDDSQSKVDTAKALGIDARLFETTDQVRSII
ncbi:HAD-IA family hydrolase [Candidatus Saccharibacteria bacterium]|nr:HAD-IA family hydrolase [Candidatus Saccharibacteria bacterium]MBP7834542.1 HAD-IA family hydrolase [Candidatus Saccharibacteria bacterium]